MGDPVPKGRHRGTGVVGTHEQPRGWRHCTRTGSSAKACKPCLHWPVWGPGEVMETLSSTPLPTPWGQAPVQPVPGGPRGGAASPTGSVQDLGPAARQAADEAPVHAGRCRVPWTLPMLPALYLGWPLFCTRLCKITPPGKERAGPGPASALAPQTRLPRPGTSPGSVSELCPRGPSPRHVDAASPPGSRPERGSVKGRGRAELVPRPGVSPAAPLYCLIAPAVLKINEHLAGRL